MKTILLILGMLVFLALIAVLIITHRHVVEHLPEIVKQNPLWAGVYLVLFSSLIAPALTLFKYMKDIIIASSPRSSDAEHTERGKKNAPTPLKPPKPKNKK
jgi:hypothetical protein